jgi:hypothetical protein
MATRPNGTQFRIGVKVIEYWTYDRGNGRFPVSIRIEDGSAKTIEFLPRRYVSEASSRAALENGPTHA